MILMASSSPESFPARPMCQPPKQMIDTLAPVLPSALVGMPLAVPDSCPSKIDAPMLSNAAVASPVSMNSRRVAMAAFCIVGTSCSRKKLKGFGFYDAEIDRDCPELANQIGR